MATRRQALAAVALATAGAGSATAQVATDGSVGPERELAGPHYTIAAELGTQAGGNLFHSFRHFSIGSGESATFTGPGVDNVIARVTGGERSVIDGILRAAIPDADLYFIKPAGVLFGPDATLDVGGAFHVSTADELRFADGAVFSAANPTASSLTVAAPVAFGFLDRDPASIEVRDSGLLVPPGEALSLVGGDLTVSGGLTGILLAPAGRLTLAALASPGSFRIAEGTSSAAHGGRVALDDFALLQVSGDGDGEVLIRAGELMLTDNSLILADNLGASQAQGGVDVEVVDARIDRGAAIVAEALGSGAGPAVTVAAAGTLRLADGGFISSRSLSTGAPGAVTIAAGRVHLAGSPTRQPTGIATDPLDPASLANAGPVAIRAARSIVIENGSQISTRTAVNEGGPITLEAPRVVIADATSRARSRTWPKPPARSASGPTRC
jgi:filamentous hemagglutinin family protein